MKQIERDDCELEERKREREKERETERERLRINKKKNTVKVNNFSKNIKIDPKKARSSTIL